MDIASKVIQATKTSNLRRKAANKKPRSTKTINSSHWDSKIRQATLEKKALDEEVEKEKASEKAWKEQEKLEKWTTNEVRKALNKLVWKAKAAETQREKKVDTQKKIERAEKREENRLKKLAVKTAKKTNQASKITNKKRNKKVRSSIASSLEDLLMIEEESTQMDNTQACQSDTIEDTWLPSVNQLGYDNNNNNAATQLVSDL